jgi:hypothetical protein
VINSIIEIVHHDKISSLMFKLIDKVFMGNEEIPKFSKTRTSKTKVSRSIDQIANDYLLKDEQP